MRSNRPSVHILSGCGSRRNGSDTHQVRPSDERTHEDRDHHMFIIGIERHKLSHTAVAVDSFRDRIDTIRVDAGRHQRRLLLE